MYRILLKQLDPKPTISLDTDWFYHRGSVGFMSLVKGPLVRLEYFVGEIYEFVIRRPVLGAANLMRKFDGLVIDSAAVGTGRSTQTFSQAMKTLVSGHVQHYGLIMAAGILALLVLAVLAL